jgi:hypothetical protein
LILFVFFVFFVVGIDGAGAFAADGEGKVFSPTQGEAAEQTATGAMLGTIASAPRGVAWIWRRDPKQQRRGSDGDRAQVRGG